MVDERERKGEEGDGRGRGRGREEGRDVCEVRKKRGWVCEKSASCYGGREKLSGQLFGRRT